MNNICNNKVFNSAFNDFLRKVHEDFLKVAIINDKNFLLKVVYEF